MNKLKSLFQDKIYIIFLIFVFLFYIIFYQYINIETKKQIYNIITKPIVFISILILLCVMLYNHLTIGIILILAFLLSLTCGDIQKKKIHTQNIKEIKSNNNEVVNTDNYGYDENIDRDDNLIIDRNGKHIDVQINKNLLNNILRNNQDNQENQEGFNDFFSDKLKSMTNSFNQAIKENQELELDIKKKKKERYTSTSEKSKKIKKRKFDLTNKEDKKLLYAKQLLENIINRIEYKYDDRDYLKKYIESKIENIINILGLLEDD